MKESLWGYWLIVLGIFILSVMLLLQNYTTTNEQDVYLIKEITDAAMGDSLGIMMIVLGMMVIYGISFASLKLLTVLVVFWFASPVCSHLLAKLEVSTNEQIEDECEVPKE